MRNEHFNKNKPQFDLHLILCGNEKCAPGFTMRPHMRKYYLIHYIESGQGFFEEKNRLHKIAGGDIFVIYPDTLVSYYAPDRSNPFTFCWIGFNGENAEKYLDCAGVDRDNPVVRLNNTDFSSSVNHMVDCFEKDRYVSEIMLNRHLLRCMRSIEKSVQTPVKHQNNSISYTEDAIAFIEKNYMTAISAKDVVSYLKLNRSYLYRIFKSQTEMSLGEYLIRYRIERAKELIRFSDFSFSQIAGCVGVNDIYYFSRLFKRVTGVSPSEYKKSIDR